MFQTPQSKFTIQQKYEKTSSIPSIINILSTVGLVIDMILIVLLTLFTIHLSKNAADSKLYYILLSIGIVIFPVWQILDNIFGLIANQNSEFYESIRIYLFVKGGFYGVVFIGISIYSLVLALTSVTDSLGYFIGFCLITGGIFCFGPFLTWLFLMIYENDIKSPYYILPIYSA